MSYNPVWDNPNLVVNLSVATNNDLAWQDTGGVLVQTFATPFSVSGIAAPVADRPPVRVLNLSGQTMTVKNLQGSSAGNQIDTGTGADLSIANKGVVTLLYDFAGTVWRVVGKYP